MPEINAAQMGGTMRLGARPTIIRRKLKADPTTNVNEATATSGTTVPRTRSLASDLYGRDVKVIWERHRHRYEVNPEYVQALESAGLHFTGVDDRSVRMEIVELDRAIHPYFFAVQYHPEFQSQPHRPSPPFLGLILAAAKELEQNLPLTISASRRAKGLASTDVGMNSTIQNTPPRSLNASLMSIDTSPGDSRLPPSRLSESTNRSVSSISNNADITPSTVVAPIEKISATTGRTFISNEVEVDISNKSNVHVTTSD
jgi:Glutamine amidotransferase class-I